MAQQLRRSSRVSRPPQRFEDQPFLVGYDKEGRAVYETHNDVAAHLLMDKMCPAKRKRIREALERDVAKGSVPASLLRAPVCVCSRASAVACVDSECAFSSAAEVVCDAECECDDCDDDEGCEEPDDDDATDESFITDSDAATPSDEEDGEEDEFVSEDDTESTECVVLSDDCDETDEAAARTDEEDDLSESDGGPDAGDCLHPACDLLHDEDEQAQQPDAQQQDADVATLDCLHPACDPLQDEDEQAHQLDAQQPTLDCLHPALEVDLTGDVVIDLDAPLDLQLPAAAVPATLFAALPFAADDAAALPPPVLLTSPQ